MTKLKRALIGTAFLLFATSSQAVIVETISGYSGGETVTATADATSLPTTRVVHFDSSSTISDNTYTIADVGKVMIPGTFFSHSYVFESVVDTVVALSLVTENGLSDLISALTLTISGTDIATVVDNTQPLTIGFQMTAGETYTVNLEGTPTGSGSDYRLEVSQVPVPAAVWLFGSAILGLVGLRRKGKMDAVAA